MDARIKFALIAGLGSLGSMLAAPAAQAVPSFAAQTGQPCTACHIGGFGPQLTPLGRAFKIGGYTQSGGEGWRSKVPLSVMALGSFSKTASDLPQGQQTPHYGVNDNFALDQVSVFIAGRLSDYSGGFMQLTYSPIDVASHLDNTDLRPFTSTVDIGDRELRYGFSINNTPTVQDPFNTTFAWGFPYVASALAPTQSAQPVLAGSFAGNTIGYTAYAWFDRSLYLEGGVYQTQNAWMQTRFGTTLGPGSSAGMMPYLRAAYEWNWDTSSAHVGALFMQSRVNPTVSAHIGDASNGRDLYTDFGVDASYSYLGDGTNIVTVQGIFTKENQNILGTTNASNIANGTAFGSKYSLNQIRLNASYWYQNTYGATVGWQNTWGPANPVLFQPAAVTGSNNGKPNTNMFVLEFDWVPFGKADSWMQPWANLKLGAQYTAYTQFNGASTNYDGSGRNASANNTLFLFGWMTF